MRLMMVNHSNPAHVTLITYRGQTEPWQTEAGKHFAQILRRRSVCTEEMGRPPLRPTCLWLAGWADEIGRRARSWPCPSRRRRWGNRRLSSCTAPSWRWIPPDRLCPALHRWRTQSCMDNMTCVAVQRAMCNISQLDITAVLFRTTSL